MSTLNEHHPLDSDLLPLASVSDRLRDEQAPAFLERLRDVYGDLGQVADVLVMLGVAA